MLDLLKFGISAQDRWSPQFAKMKSELGGIKGALAGVNDYAARAGRGMRNIGAGLSAGVTAPIVLFGKSALNAAKDTQEAQSMFDQVFKDTAADTRAWSRTLATEIGRSSYDLQNQAAEFQQILGKMAPDTQAAAEMSRVLAGLSQDLSSFFNTTESDAAAKLRAGLIGEAEPLRQFGVLISAAAVEERALAMGLAETKKELTEQDKVLARYRLILEQTSDAQGDAARTSGSLTNRERALGAAFQDLRITLGNQLIPIFTDLTGKLVEGVNWFGSLSPEMQRTGVALGAIAAAAGPVLAFLGMAAIGVSTLSGAFATLGALLLANPIGLAIAAIAAGAYLVYRNWEGVQAWFSDLWAGVKSATASAWEAIKSVFLNYTAAGLIYQHWDQIGTWFMTQWHAVSGSISLAWDGIKALLAGTYGPQQLIYGLWQGIGDWFAGLAPELTAAFQTLWEAITTEVSSWPGRMIQFGKDAIAGFVQGLSAGEVAVGSASRKVAREAADAAREALDSHSPSRVFMSIGRDVAAGLGIGIAEGAPAALAQAKAMAEGVIETGQNTLGFMGTVRDGLKSIFTSVLSGASTFAESIRSTLSSIGGNLINSAVGTIFDELWPFAKGGVVSGGRVQAFASGGVVSGPTVFPMRGGTGLMGEAGPEAIMPLARGGDGKLGVRAQVSRKAEAVQLTYAPQIDARGADVAAVARLEAQMRQMAAGFEVSVQQALRYGNNRRQMGR